MRDHRTIIRESLDDRFAFAPSRSRSGLQEQEKKRPCADEAEAEFKRGDPSALGSIVSRAKTAGCSVSQLKEWEALLIEEVRRGAQDCCDLDERSTGKYDSAKCVDATVKQVQDLFGQSVIIEAFCKAPASPPTGAPPAEPGKPPAAEPPAAEPAAKKTCEDLYAVLIGPWNSLKSKKVCDELTSKQMTEIASIAGAPELEFICDESLFAAARIISDAYDHCQRLVLPYRAGSTMAQENWEMIEANVDGKDSTCFCPTPFGTFSWFQVDATMRTMPPHQGLPARPVQPQPPATTGDR